MKPILARIARLSTNQAFILAGVLSFLFYISPFFDDGSAVDARIANVKGQLNAEKAKEKESDLALARIKQLKESYAALTDQFKIVSAAVPSDMQMSEVIRTVDSVSKIAGVSIRTKEPRKTIREDILEILPISVRADGTYSEITMFLYKMASVERIYRVRSFNMAASTDLKNRRLPFEAEIASFRFVGNQKPTPTPGRR
ncbi:MAG: hypothetical protein C5B49_11185 [Bdellovibrio sp.]|nr:MAG: hypothetical protein C5B49_11185 [Bdellovibrio sp.]